MNGKKILICVIVIAVVGLVIGFAFYSVYRSDLVKVTYNENRDDVDDGVEAIMGSEKYKSMSEDEQIKIVGELLKEYEKNEKITSLHYSEDEVLYSFEYNSGDKKGTFGGVSLKNWDLLLN